MSFDRSSFIEKLKDSYEYYYDVKTFDTVADESLPLKIFAEFHVCDEGYVLSKRAKIWTSESSEYVYVFSAPSFDIDMVSRCIDHALADGQSRIAPHPNHRSSFIITVFVADTMESDAQDKICKRKYDKSHKMGLHGWSALKTAYIDLEKEMIATNRAGRDLRKFFGKLLRSEKS